MAKISKADALATAERMAADPIWFVREVLGGDPWCKQCDILNSVRDNRRTSVRSCHGVGKTRAAAWAALWYALTHPDSVVVTTAPTWTQVESILWREIRGAYANAKYPLGGKLTNTQLELDNNWVAFGRSTDVPERFQGIHSASGDILLIVDEAAGVEQDIYDAAEGFLTSTGARVLLIGNPTLLSGEFYNSFKGDLYNKISISAFDSPNLQDGAVVRPYLITSEWVEEKRKKWGENSPLWYSRVLGEFPTSNDGTLIPLAWIERAQARWTDTIEPANVVLGADIGLGNPDPACIVKRTGSAALTRIERVRDVYSDDTMELSGIITNDIKALKATDVNVDKIGLGAGVTDRLRENSADGTIAANVRGINSAMPPVDTTRYFNLRAEMGWELREAFERNSVAIDPKDDEAAEELAAVRTYGASGLDGKGRIRLEPKAETKERLGRSPNFFDAACLAASRTLSKVTISRNDKSAEVERFSFNDDGVRNERIAKFLAGRKDARKKKVAA